jgi:hypothetical protein
MSFREAALASDLDKDTIQRIIFLHKRIQARVK